MTTPMVIDLSHWNVVTDFAAIRRAGIYGVIHKVSEGASGVDLTYPTRRRAATDAGLLWGAYHFLRPGDMVAQAQFFLDEAKPSPTTLLAVDHEDRGVSPADLKTFLATVREKSGTVPILYSGYVIKEQLGAADDPDLGFYPLWLAQYTQGEPTWPKGTWDNWWLWQFTSGATIDGVSAPCDASAYHGTAADLIQEWPHAAAPATAEKTAPQAVTIDVTAPEGIPVYLTVNGQSIGGRT